ncbi:hypothetical protein IKE_01605 [Bacillus cereus VD196]|uniref:Uncharacterized protein n=1 Tax=Bacillus cereus VD196 TaxID=1053243 RepID=A0A9W5Q5Z3_BACCE|nr:hypothetical protein [Bacillus cereus]EOO68131.1 hypothetical protein IKE_01605 [Bacillus cereus VD196]
MNEGFTIADLAPLIPVGSAFLGALTGGTITYGISRSTKNKESKLKSVESISELKRLIYIIYNSACKVQCMIEAEREKGDLILIYNKLGEFIEEVEGFFNKFLSGEWSDFYIKAVHISNEVFTKTKQTYFELSSYKGKTEQNESKIREEGIEWFLEETKAMIDKSVESLEGLMEFLEDQESKLINEYMKKYIKE